MKVTVIGTGYVGLVSGTCLAEVGHDVTCVDIDTAKIEKLNQGIMPIYEPGLQDLVHKNQEAGRLHFAGTLGAPRSKPKPKLKPNKIPNSTETADTEAETKVPEVLFFALPTPPGGDGEADLSYVLSAAKDVARHIRRYTVIVNKSTVPVGTARKVRAVMEAETDVPFDVVSNPEFLREGFAVEDFLHADRIVVGTASPQARAVMEELYRPFTADDVPLLFMDEASAEMTKYAANSFLATKISFMNEIANLCELVGANVDNVREGIGADERIGHRFLYAGIGYGGSCFPKDVMALSRVAEAQAYDFKILKAVMDVNARQKQILLAKITAHMGERLQDKTFAVWGLAFKADTDDIREAPSEGIIRALLERGATVQVYDPEAMTNMQRVFPPDPAGITYAASAIDALQGADALAVVTEWKEFLAVEPAVLAAALQAKVVFDGRNVFEPHAMEAAGLTYFSIGRSDIVMNKNGSEDNA